MTEAQKKLLLTIAKALHDNPSFCKDVYNQLDWKEQDNYRGYGQAAADIGYTIFSNMITDFENES